MKRLAFVLALLGLMTFWSCDQEPSGHPCDNDPTITQRILSDKYDHLFPYNHNSKQLTYLYSNDTITNDTMVFDLVDYTSWDVDTTSAERCFIDYQEVQRLLYKSTSSVFKKLTILRKGGATFDWEVREKWESFSYQDLKYSDFEVYNSAFFRQPHRAGEIINQMEVNGINYYDVYLGLQDFKCDTLGSKLIYSPNYGFLEIYDACENEHFTLINP